MELNKLYPFVKHFDNRKLVVLLVHKDKIILTRGDEVELKKLKCFLIKEFKTKDLGSLKYFLGRKWPGLWRKSQPHKENISLTCLKREDNVIITEEKIYNKQKVSVTTEGRKRLNGNKLPGHIRKCSRTDNDQTETTQVKVQDSKSELITPGSRPKERRNQKRRETRKLLGLTAKERRGSRIPAQEEPQNVIWVCILVAYMCVGLSICATWPLHERTPNPHGHARKMWEQQHPHAPQHTHKHTRSYPHTQPACMCEQAIPHDQRMLACAQDTCSMRAATHKCAGGQAQAQRTRPSLVRQVCTSHTRRPRGLHAARVPSRLPTRLWPS